MNYKFNHRGSLSGHAFTCAGLDGLRDKVRQIESRGGISAGYNGCYTMDTDAEAVSEGFTDGPGAYLTSFTDESNADAEHFDTEAEALVAYIEERTETRCV